MRNPLSRKAGMRQTPDAKREPEGQVTKAQNVAPVNRRGKKSAGSPSASPKGKSRGK